MYSRALVRLQFYCFGTISCMLRSECRMIVAFVSDLYARFRSLQCKLFYKLVATPFAW